MFNVNVDTPSELTDAQLDAAIAHEWENLRELYSETDVAPSGTTLYRVARLYDLALETPSVDLALGDLTDLITAAKSVRQDFLNLRPLLEEREERQWRAAGGLYVGEAS